MFAASKTAAPAAAATYIEDVFSTYLYTGNGSTQTITNGIDLSTYGGLVWMKRRSTAANHQLYDTARGATKKLASNETTAEATETLGLTAFNSTGFALGSDSNANGNGSTYASWTFRKQAKFFDVVTYTGTGANRTVAHNLGSVPGCIITKRTDTTGNWITYHRSLGNTDFVNLNTTAGTSADSGAWNNTTPTSTEFSLGTGNTNVNGGTYVAYLFAHDAGGFGLTGTDNVISCGSFTTDSGGTASVTLGYEPQWVMTKNSSGISAWRMFDTMRGMTVAGQNDALLQAQSSVEEITNSDYCSPTATGFGIAGHDGSATHIYIAIRRGPMKTPTSGTSVFSPNTYTGNSSTQNITTNFPVDFFLNRNRFSAGLDTTATDRLRGFGTSTPYLFTNSTAAEGSASNAVVAMPNTTLNMGSWSQINFSSESYVGWNFRRAPGFFDVVCYTGTGVNRTVTHNLGVAPELMIIKSRSGAYGWPVYAAAPGPTQFAYLDDTGGFSANSTAWNDTAPTASVFTVGTGSLMNTSSVTYVAYLFATVSGVSKVGSYTGTGTTKQIDCGFTGGARFVLIKRTDDTGDWYVWDSARGIVSGNDPYLRLNSTAAEVTNTDYVDTYSAGFEISSTAPAAINANGGTFVFLAVA